MAGNGPVPAENHTRKGNDHKQISLVSDGKLRGPVLPRNVLKKKDGTAEAWHPMTVKWWNNWRKSPQAIRMMTGPDWDFMLDTALMHHEMWITRRFELAGEIRLRVQQFGATPEARARLRLEIGVKAPNTPDVPESEAPGSNVTSIGASRRRQIKEA